MKITNEILEAYLNCKTKGHLKLAGETGTKSDYEAMTAAASRASREEAIAKLVARFGEGDACRGVAVTAATLKQGAPLLADATLEDEGMSIRFDALKRADGASKLGDHHYLPVLHDHGDKVGRQQKLLLAVLGLVLARVQGLRPAVGLVARGPEGRLGKVWLDAKLYRQAEQVLDEVKRLQAGRRAAAADAQRALPGLRVPAAVPQAGGGGGRHQPARGRGREGVEAVQPQGHLHPDATVLHLPPAEEGQAGQAEDAHPLPRLAGPGHPREEDPRLRHAGPARQAGAGLPRRRGHARRASSTCSACSSSRATTEKMLSFWADGKDQEAEIFQRSWTC